MTNSSCARLIIGGYNAQNRSMSKSLVKNVYSALTASLYANRGDIASECVWRCVWGIVCQRWIAWRVIQRHTAPVSTRKHASHLRPTWSRHVTSHISQLAESFRPRCCWDAVRTLDTDSQSHTLFSRRQYASKKLHQLFLYVCRILPYPYPYIRI